MSLSTFKSNMRRYMNNQGGIDKYDDWADKLTSEYDKLVKRGNEAMSTPNKFLKGNTSGMKMLVKSACRKALNATSNSNNTFYNDLGKAIISYWQLSELMQFPPPLMPGGPGAMQNIMINKAPTEIPGTWKPGKFFPTDNVDTFLDKLSMGIEMHLMTVGGTYYMLCLYPGSPPFSSPGILPWKGFIVPPSPPSTPTTPDTPSSSFFGDVLSAIVDAVKDVLMTPAQIESAKLEKAEADAVANNTALPASGRSSAAEYSKLKSSEISSGEINAAPVSLSDEELAAIEENTPDEYKCEDGTKIVAIARRDIGILEYGTPPGLNYGGFPGGKQINGPGRIDEMFTNVGLNNQAKVSREGSGYYWCAAAVATWWQEAGLDTPRGGASCDNWMDWGKQKGYWSSKPKIGAAVLYGSPADAHHIGIVAGVTDTGGIITIEGNTGGGAFSRNGCGVFQKVPRKYLGFVLPPSCV